MFLLEPVLLWKVLAENKLGFGCKNFSKLMNKMRLKNVLRHVLQMKIKERYAKLTFYVFLKDFR